MQTIKQNFFMVWSTFWLFSDCEDKSFFHEKDIFYNLFSV